MTDFATLIRLLVKHNIDFIIIGGAAATTHGSARLTEDLDVVYGRTPENMARLAACLIPYKPYLRGAPPGLPFQLDAATIQRGLNFPLTTDLGALDLFGEIPEGGRYEDLIPHTITITLFGATCRCLGLKRLIEVKRAAGRPRDLEVVAELEALLEEREGRSPGGG
jgi:predicted nucleotidyltransferase